MQDSSGQLKSKNIEDSLPQDDLNNSSTADPLEPDSGRRKSKSEMKKRNTVMVKKSTGVEFEQPNRFDRHGNPITTQIGTF